MKKPSEIRVVIIEDSTRWQEAAKIILEELGVTVVAIVADFLTATQDTIPKLEQLGVSYVLLDANLTEGENGGYEGEEMEEQIRKQAKAVKIIGFSMLDQAYADIEMGKPGLTKEALKRAMGI